ncbi:YjcZ family sporulation protein [Priestia aryabhattai]
MCCFGGFGGYGFGSCGYGGGSYGGSFALIVVLFILLVIVGATCFWGK